MELKYDSLLKYFQSDDIIRPALQQSNTVNGFIYASDAHIMFFAPVARFEKEYPAHEKTPDFKYVLSGIQDCNALIFPVEDIEKAIKKFELVWDESPCPDCDGEGQCPHCRKECDRCGSSGTLEDRRLPKVLPSTDAGIKILDRLYAPRYMDLIARTAKAVGEDRIILTGRSGTIARFEFADCTIALARLDPDNYEIEDFQIVDLNPASSI